MDLAALGLTVNADGSIVALDRFSGAANRATRAGTGVENMAHQLQRAMLALGLSIGAREIANYADSWNSLQARTELVAQNHRVAGQVMHDLYAVANDTRTAFDSTANVYLRVARNAEVLGRSQNELIKFTKTVNQTLLIGAVNSHTAAQGLYQLGQALASGRLQGDEFRSVMEALPELAQTIARGLGVNVSELRKLSKEGKLTSDEIIEAVLKMSDEVEKRAAGIPLTIGQAFTVLGNQFHRYIGNLDDARGLTQILTQSIVSLANNIGNLVKAFTALMILLAARWLSDHITRIYQHIQARVLEARAVRETSVQSTFAAQAEAAAEMEVARAREAATRATIAELVARREAIILIRAEALANLQAARQTQAQLVNVVRTDSGRYRGDGGRFMSTADGEAALAARAAATRAATTATRELAQVGAAEAAIVSRLAVANTTLAAQTTATTIATRLANSAAATHTVTMRAWGATMLVVRSAASAMWTAIGGPIGAIIIGITVLTMLINRFNENMQKGANRVAEFRGELAAMKKAEVLAAGADIDREIWEVERRREAMVESNRRWRAMGQDVDTPNPFTGRTSLGDIDAELANLKAMKAAQEEQLETLADMDEIIGKANENAEELSRKERARLRIIADITASLLAMKAAADKTLESARLQGMAQQEFNIREEGAADLARIRSDLNEKLISQSIRASDVAELTAMAEEATTYSVRKRIEALGVAATLQARQTGGDRQRELEQELEVSLLGNEAQEEARIKFAAVNKEITARRNLTGEALNVTLESIRAEEQLAGQLIKVQRLATTIRNTFQETFSQILTGGMDKFSDLFTGIKQMFIRMISEMLVNEAMREFGPKLMGLLKSIQHQSTDSSAGMPTEMVTGENGEVTVRLSSVSNAAGKSWGQMAMPYLAAALAAFNIGGMIGGQTTNRALGTIGGAAGGAASGAAVGSVVPGLGTAVGAIVGGIAGALGGFMGASKRRSEEEQQLRDTLRANNIRLTELRMSLDASTLSGRNYDKADDMITALEKQIKLGNVSGRDLRRAFNGEQETSFTRALTSQFGLSFEQLNAIIKQTGIQIFDSGGKIIPEAFAQLREAIGLTIKSITTLGNDADSLRKRQEARDELYGVTKTPAHELESSYDILMKMAPELMKQMGLANLNLDSEAGRNTLLAGLREIFEMMDSGSLTVGLLGAFTNADQLLEAILRASQGLHTFADQLAGVTTDFPRAMDVLLYEQRYGRGTGETPNSQWTQNKGEMINIRQIVILSDKDETPEQLLVKLETAVSDRAAQGGYTYLPRTVTEE